MSDETDRDDLDEDELEEEESKDAAKDDDVDEDELEDDDDDDDDDDGDDDADDDDDDDDADDDDDDEDDDEDDEPAPKPEPKKASAKKRPAKKRATKKRPAKKRPRPSGRGAGKREERAAPATSPKKEQPSSGGGNAMLFAIVALVIGVAGGWFARDAQAKKDVDAAPDPAVAVAPAPSGSGAPAGPCGQWQATLCKEAGEQSEACQQAKAGAGVMPDAACTKAIAELPATLAKVKAARGICTELIEKLCKDIGEKTESCKLVREKTPSFPTARCKQMMDSYDKVIEQLRKIEEKNAPLKPEVAAKQAAGNGPSFGPDDAKVTIVEYSDFECPFCAKAATVVGQLKDKYKDKNVRFVFRQYPLPMHKNAQLAAEAALAAHAQGKFWAMHDAMFANIRALDRESLEAYADKAGLDMAKFKKALDDHTYADQVKADMELGKEIGVSGTPTMIVNTKRVANPTDLAALSALIDGELGGG